MAWKKQQPGVKRPKGIDPGGKVKLAIADLPSVDARVEDVGETHAILGLAREPDRPLTEIGPAEATLEAVTSRGEIRVVAHVSQHNGERDAVRVDFDREAEVIQRRDFFRLELMTDVVLNRESGALVEAKTLDISASGLRLAGPLDLREGERLWVAIDVEDEDAPVRAHGHVLRVTDRGQVVVNFDLIEEAARDRLIRFLFTRQRRAAWVRDG